jgi:hypothetical protein
VNLLVVMVRKIFILLVILMVFLVSCSSQNDTADVVVEKGTETLSVLVVDINGNPLPGAEVYVNNQFNGLTREFGQTQGTRTFLLVESLNQVFVKKEGYETSDKIMVQKNGHQQAKFVLERSTTTLIVLVGDELSEVVVSLREIDTATVEQTVLTDETGVALFDDVADGDYIVTLVRQDYQPIEERIKVDYTTRGSSLEARISLQSNPLLSVVVIRDDDPLQEVEVSLYTRTEYNTPGILPSKTRITSNTGESTFRDLVFGERYVIVAKKEGFSAQIIERTLEEGDTSLKIEMSED